MNGHTWSKQINTSGLKKNVSKNTGIKRNTRKPLPKPHETEEEAIIRRFHDAQRMARFRAKKKRALEEAKILKATNLTDMSLVAEFRKKNIAFEITNSLNSKEFQAHLFMDKAPFVIQPTPVQRKYSQLLAVIEELGKDIRLTYAGSRSSVERLKIGIVQARMLVKDCLLETAMNA